jgi:dihydroneopterin aldolase
LTRCHFIKPSALSSLVEQVEDSVLKAAMTERWQVVQAKKLALEKPSIRPPGMKM